MLGLVEEFPASLDDLNLNIVRLSYEVTRGMLIIFGIAWSLRNIQIIFFMYMNVVLFPTSWIRELKKYLHMTDIVTQREYIRLNKIRRKYNKLKYWNDNTLIIIDNLTKHFNARVCIGNHIVVVGQNTQEITKQYGILLLFLVTWRKDKTPVVEDIMHFGDRI